MLLIDLSLFLSLPLFLLFVHSVNFLILLNLFLFTKTDMFSSATHQMPRLLQLAGAVGARIELHHLRLTYSIVARRCAALLKVGRAY